MPKSPQLTNIVIPLGIVPIIVVRDYKSAEIEIRVLRRDLSRYYLGGCHNFHAYRFIADHALTQLQV
jgi:hypothetical protein